MPRRKKVTIDSTNHRSSMSINKDKPQQRNAANARERARMRVLSRAFCRLKTTLPWVPADTKLSKLDTLRLASSYIAHLKGILEDDPYKPEEPLHPALTLTWPFGFNRVGVSTGSGGGGSGSEGEDDNGVLDDGDSCVSGSSWEEVTLPVSHRMKDRIHLDSQNINKVPSFGTNSTGTNGIYPQHLQHLSNFHENILSFS